jgi:hypothetical protein
LVQSVGSPAAVGKTFELVAARGAATADIDALFGALDEDAAGSVDGVRDIANMPSEQEPARVREDLQALAAQAVLY